jgi:hypothetical protein
VLKTIVEQYHIHFGELTHHACSAKKALLGCHHHALRQGQGNHTELVTGFLHTTLNALPIAYKHNTSRTAAVSTRYNGGPMPHAQKSVGKQNNKRRLPRSTHGHITDADHRNIHTAHTFACIERGVSTRHKSGVE